MVLVESRSRTTTRCTDAQRDAYNITPLTFCPPLLPFFHLYSCVVVMTHHFLQRVTNVEQKYPADETKDMLLESELMPGGIIVYYADGNEEILHVNRYILDLFECKTFDEFMEHTGGTFKGFVHASDVNAAEDSIWSQVEARDRLDHIYYQIRTKTGRLVSVDDYGRLVPREGKRPLFYVFVVEMDRGSAIDWLTGLPGMERFKYLAGMELTAGISRKRKHALVTFDLMGMKLYNSRHGREGGDQLLQVFANILRDQFGSEACCRYSGDSFSVLCDVEGVEKRVREVFAKLAASDVPAAPPVMAGACIANAQDDISSLIDRAKYACDSDNMTWKSHLSWFTDEMLSAANMRIHVLDNMDRALAEGWVRPYYQGVVRAATGRVYSEEALARWVDPTLGLLSPAQFVPVLEEAGMLRKLDMHMVDCVLADLSARLSAGEQVVPISVNLSLRDLHDTDMASEIARKANEAGVPHDLLHVEFTESTASGDPDLLKSQIKTFHANGFEVWMDDFGSEYSSLNALKDFNFDLIKLDMGFLRGEYRGKSSVIVDGVICAAKRLGLRVLAEGVETEDRANGLAQMGCDMLQGYYYAKPSPRDELRAARDVDGAIPFEPRDEVDYWNAVGAVNLTDLASSNEVKSVDESSTREVPVGVLEFRNDTCYILRANNSLRSILASRGAIAEDGSMTHTRPARAKMSRLFRTAVERCRASGTWERVTASTRYGSEFQFFVKPVASCKAANAYVVTSASTLLGSALGTYGDVPVAYAVLRLIMNEEGDRAIDAEYLYANDWYRDWGGLGVSDFTGKRLLEIAPETGIPWLPLCYRAAMHGESVHDVLYSPAARHWISFNVAPSPAEGHCVFAFMLADAEQRERQHIIEDRNTSWGIIDIMDTLNDELDYDVAMQGLLESLGNLIHPDRLYIFEKGEHTTSNTFEWCAPGVVPQIDTLQDLDNSEFDTWDEILTHESSVVIKDVEAYKGVDDRMYWQLSRQGIVRMLAVPLYADDKLVGYLGADNYAFGEGVNSQRLLETVASFVGSRIASRNVVDALESAGMHDSLTGLWNRRGIDAEMAARTADEPNAPLVLMLLDVDDFKIINDLYGHDVGDEALRVLAQELRDTFPETAIIGRNGGDEALVALFGSDADSVDELLETLTSKKLSCELHGRRYPLSLSVGYAWHHPGDDLKTTYTRADEALYSVKLGDKSGYRKWTAELEDSPQRALLGFTSRDLAEGMPLAMVAHRFNGEILFANDGLARLLDYERSRELFKDTGRNMRDFIHPEDWERIKTSIPGTATAALPGMEQDISFRVLTRTGAIRDVVYRARFVSTSSRGDVLYAYMVDKHTLE